MDITRRLEIDAGHRIPNHGSKCKNLHGHRYVLEATVTAEDLVKDGEQEGMVLDFGFLKQDMVEVLHDVYDHRFMLYVDDPLRQHLNGAPGLVIVPEVPTAENLARLWGTVLAERIRERVTRDDHSMYLSRFTVWETPNCRAEISFNVSGTPL
jgi:6-pyruvoyltetrahydropterin/6-carboxytetrahydropterin synthase